jgi:hypothetical protein
VIFGVERDAALAHLARAGTPAPADADFRGKRPAGEFRAALRNARVYLGGARWEDFGMAPLEALADGALVATVPSGGPFEALAMARELAPELVAETVAPEPLSAALLAAFELPEARVEDYRRRASALIERFRPEAIDRTIAADVLPALLG